MDYPDYNPASPLTPLAASELEALEAQLTGLRADGVMSLDGLDGYLTALLSMPRTAVAQLAAAEWLPVIWGGDAAAGAEAAAPFASKRQKKATVVLVLRHMRHIEQQLREAADTWEPIFSIAEHGDDEWADARDWCAGFLQAVDLWPTAWAEVWDDADLGPALAPLLVLGGGLDAGDASAAADAADADAAAAGPDGADLDDPEICDGLSRAVPDAVLRLRAARLAG